MRSCSRCQSDSTWKRAGTRMARGGFWGREVGGVGGALGGEEGFEEGGESTAAQLGGGHFRCVFLSSEEFESWEGRW